MRKPKFSLFLLFLLVTYTFLSTQDVPISPGLKTARAATATSLKEKCRSCRLTLTNRDVLEGSLHDVQEGSLVLLSRDNFARSAFQGIIAPEIQTTVPFDMIESIRCGDPYYDGLYKGLFIGGVVTAVFLGIFTSAMDDSPPDSHNDDDAWKAMGWGFAIGGAVGAAFGITFDAAVGYPVEQIDPDILRKEWDRP